MYLGELIERLEAAPRQNALVRMKRVQPDGVESYGPVGCLTSWRGAYENTTLDGDPGDYSVRDLVAYLKSRVGQTMQGYKGGDYTISDLKPVFADRYGEADGWMVVAVEVQATMVCIVAAKGALYW